MDWKYLLTSFQGRINRQPFWLSFLVLSVVSTLLFLAVMAVFGTWVTAVDPGQPSIQLSPIGWVLAVVLYVALVWFGLAIQIKRWHDRDKSGWWVLISLVPFIGSIWMIVEAGFLRGTIGPNRFGPDPLA